MILLTTHEAHYLKYQDGYYDPANYTVGGYFDDMLAVFDQVVFVGRCEEVKDKPDCMRVDKERVTFYPIRDFCGYTGFLSHSLAFWECRKLIAKADRYWLQGPGFVASMVAFWLRKADIPYYVHIVGDPEDVAKAKTWHWPRFLSYAVSQYYKTRFQKLVRCSRGALSVTEHYLKKKYPSGMSQNDMGVSDVRLPDEIFKERNRDYEQRPVRLIIVGVLLQYKGHDILLKALCKINSQCVWRLDIVGDGSYRPVLEKLADDLGISQKVDFCGRIKWGQDLFDKLEQADLFILSSLTEGMPRVVLEAMAKSLPVIAANVGGVSEVLPSDVLFKPGDVDGLADVISETWNNPARLKQLSQMNYKRIQYFRQVHLSRMRRQWLQRMRNGWQPDSEC